MSGRPTRFAVLLNLGVAALNLVHAVTDGSGWHWVWLVAGLFNISGAWALMWYAKQARRARTEVDAFVGQLEKLVRFQRFQDELRLADRRPGQPTPQGEPT